MHVNWDIILSVSGFVLWTIFGFQQMVQGVRDGQPRRRLFGLSWVVADLIYTIGALLPHGAPHYLFRLIGLGIMCYSLWVLFTLPMGQKPDKPVA